MRERAQLNWRNRDRTESAKRIVAAVAVLVVCILFRQPVDVLAQREDSGRPVVLFIHGINQGDKTDAGLKDEWFDAFNRGLDAARIRPTILKSDFWPVIYRKLYRRNFNPPCPADEEALKRRVKPWSVMLQEVDRQRAAAKAEFDEWKTKSESRSQALAIAKTPESDKDKREREELLRQQIEARLAREEARRRFTRATEVERLAKLDLRAAEAEAYVDERRHNESFAQQNRILWSRLAEALSQFIADNAPRNVVKALVKLFLDEADLYLTDWPHRCATDAILEGELERAQTSNRPVVLVAHSLGTIVALNVLRTGSGKVVINRFVSLGGQLGIEDFIHEFLGGLNPPFPVPAQISTWTNLKGDGDALSPYLVRSLYDVSKIPIFSDGVIDTSSGDLHSAMSYLRSPFTAQAIAYAWCHSFKGALQPRGCSAITDAVLSTSTAQPPP